MIRGSVTESVCSAVTPVLALGFHLAVGSWSTDLLSAHHFVLFLFVLHQKRLYVCWLYNPPQARCPRGDLLLPMEILDRTGFIYHFGRKPVRA